MTVSTRELSKTISHALRHEPWIYELELDEEGWVGVGSLLDSLRAKGGSWLDLSRSDIERMIARSDKRRHEIEGDRIRALYGHSIAGKLKRTAALPPERLFHGTSRETVPAILRTGLQPMGRQYVHLSVDAETAQAVGIRKDADPVILHVAARAAHASGIVFFTGNDRVWLADEVPADYLKVS